MSDKVTQAASAADSQAAARLWAMSEEMVGEKSDL